jgi:Leu/Phe-tRNA-protein transferase
MFYGKTCFEFQSQSAKIAILYEVILLRICGFKMILLQTALSLVLNAL